MFRRLLLTMFVITAFGSVLPAAAQEATPETTPDPAVPLTETFTSTDGAISFDYPDGWEVHEWQDDAPVIFRWDVSLPRNHQSGPIHYGPGVQIAVRKDVDQFFVTPGTDDIAFGVALWLREDATTARPPDDRKIGDVTTLMVGDKHAAWFLIQYGFVDTIRLIVEEGTNTVSELILSTDPGETDQWEETLLAIADSLQLHAAEADISVTDLP